MKKLVKITFVILILIVILGDLSIIKAASFSISDLFEKSKDFEEAGSSGVIEPIDPDDVTPLSNSIFTILQIIAIAVALAMVAVLGIKYMTGSIEARAEVKKTLVPYIAGALVALGAFTIWKVVVDILQNINL